MAFDDKDAPTSHHVVVLDLNTGGSITFELPGEYGQLIDWLGEYRDARTTLAEMAEQQGWITSSGSSWWGVLKGLWSKR